MTSQSISLEQPPGPDGLPIIGNTLHFAREPIGFASDCADQYGDLASFSFRNRPNIQVTHPDYIEHILSTNVDNYTKGEFMRRELQLLGDGLLTSDGELWRRQRKLIGPIFHPRRIAKFADTMVDYTERLADSWTLGEPRSIEDDMQQLTLEIVTKALFNVDIGADDTSRISNAISTVMEGFRKNRAQPIAIPRWIPLPHNIKYRRAVSTFDDVVAEIIRDHRRQTDPPDDVVTKLLQAETEDGTRMGDRQIRDEVLTLMLAGHDTTGLALSYIWYLIATHPEVEQKLVDELSTVLDGRSPELADIDQLQYTEKIMKEAMRLYPPVYFMVREPRTADVIDGYKIPEDALIWLHSWVVHHDERFYEDPEAFDPERWTDSFEAQLHDFAYIPFSGGPRRCLGDRFAMMEIQLVIATLAQRFTFDYSDPPVEIDPMVTLRPKNSITVTPHPRN